jgi:hypothetical protein
LSFKPDAVAAMISLRGAEGDNAMTETSRRELVGVGWLALACAAHGTAAAQTPGQTTNGKFVCPPCGCGAHPDKAPDQEFDGPGQCPYCAMDLIPKPAASTPKPQALSPGALR